MTEVEHKVAARLPLPIPLWHAHSRREKLACAMDYVRWKLGLLDKYLAVDYASVKRVVFVCKGNICRSAYAEAVFNLQGGAAISAGIDAIDGRPANPDAIRYAAEKGVDLSSHRTRNLARVTARPGDLFVCMESWHARAVEMSVDEPGRQILLLGGLVGVPRVSDPYGRQRFYFLEVFQWIDRSMQILRERLIEARSM